MKIGILFPGYGSQHLGMAKNLYDEYRIIQEYFEEATNCLDINFVKLCFSSSEPELSQIKNAHASIFLISASIAALLKEEGVKATFVAGSGSGGMAATFASGGISFPDGLYILNKYCTFYEEFLKNNDVSAILISKISEAELKDMCNNCSKDGLLATISFYISDNQFVVAGNTEAVDCVRRLCQDSGRKVSHYPIESGLHNELMADVVKQARVYLEKIDFKDVEVPVISDVNGNEVTDKNIFTDGFGIQILSPIRWDFVLDKMEDMDLIIQVGPGTELADGAKIRFPRKKIIAINEPQDVNELLEYLILRQTKE
ncbi:MAG: Malonyl CoA-acyl carrier protein transacylase [candidate division TM6 bacterium GW2011_GWF2_32_72]|nr:MAG: Malonyl CoA-acyl carrier protein transacylase [candidate division TM6 bacterium GW2011_GWF2_32_72]